MEAKAIDDGRSAIEEAAQAIAPFVRRTPVLELDGEDFGLPAFPLTLKLECFQRAGSFKARGAFANLLLRRIPDVGVVAASGGNHGAAVAFAAGRLGIPARIYVPSVASAAKVARIKASGATLCVAGDRYADALAASEQWAAETGALRIHAFDQAETVLGQATLGMEIESQAPGLTTLLASVGGGGLIAGLASWYRNRIRLVGVEPSSAPTLSMALAAGHPVDAPAGGIAADSLAPARIGELPFAVIQSCVFASLLVSDDDIRGAQAALWDVCRVAAEPGAVAGLAALISRTYEPSAGERVGVVISGANTTAVQFS